QDNFSGPMQLEYKNQTIASYGPWWIDYNHAPPHGAGYLSLLCGIVTRGPLNEALKESGGFNRFINENHSTNFTNAEFQIRLRGELLLQGAQLVLLVQSQQDGICSGWLLTGQPIEVKEDWTEQTLHLTPDVRQWTSLGTRPDRADMYGELPLPDVLANVNVNFFLVLFPLNVRPKGDPEGNLDELRAGRDYRVWQAYLPDGYVVVDSVSTRFTS
ncbi:MAG: hypothetical protein P1V19_21710, partial [Gimesia sp.]|nr:hypothetical protein [Gimesia sp.]